MAPEIRLRALLLAAGVLVGGTGFQAIAAAPSHVHDPIGSVQALIGRLLGPTYMPAFQLEIIPPDPATGHDVFELDTVPGSVSGSPGVTLRGNTGVAIAAGLHWYLKYECNASIAWGKGASGNQLATVPAPAQLPKPALRRNVSPVRLRYAYNVCTYGYTMPFWTFDRNSSNVVNATESSAATSPAEWGSVARALPTGSSITWREELDRLALWGVNMPLLLNGQEWTFLQTYLSVGLTEAEFIDDYLSGPAFLPWNRMGNIFKLQNPGAGLMLSWVTQQRDLQLQLLQEARFFGMTPVLAGFAGHVPVALVKKFPTANFTQNSGWAGFNASFSGNWLLEPTDPLFARLGQTFYRLQIEEFGLNPSGAPNYFNADTFNEMMPKESSPEYLRASNAAIFNAMTSVVPNAVFVMQGWLFYNAVAFWTDERIEAYLSGVPDTGMLILDLFTDVSPLWSRPGMQSYFGKPFVWNMLQYFGGRRGLYGNFSRIGEQPLVDLHNPNSTMVGLGITPESTEMGIPFFDLIWDIAWRDAPPDIEDWVDNWVLRRYGVQSPSLQAAWAILRDTNYNWNCTDETTVTLCRLEKAPELNPAIDPGAADPDAVVQALRLFVQAGQRNEVNASRSSTYSYDLVDLGRQMLCNAFTDAANVAGAEYSRAISTQVNNSVAVAATMAVRGDMLAQLDTLLATDTNFLLGHWLADATLWANGNGTVADFLEENARNQITLWGFVGGDIADYAAKNGWSGLVRDHYGARWALQAEYVVNATLTGTPVNWAAYNTELGEVEAAWVAARNPYPITPSGDALAEASTALMRFATGNVSHYHALQDTDAFSPGAGVTVDIYRAWHKDSGILMTLCDADPACVGFNSNGYLKNNTGSQQASNGVTLWLKTQ